MKTFGILTTLPHHHQQPEWMALDGLLRPVPICTAHQRVKESGVFTNGIPQTSSRTYSTTLSIMAPLTFGPKILCSSKAQKRKFECHASGIFHRNKRYFLLRQVLTSNDTYRILSSALAWRAGTSQQTICQ